MPLGIARFELRYALFTQTLIFSVSKHTVANGFDWVDRNPSAAAVGIVISPDIRYPGVQFTIGVGDGGREGTCPPPFS